MKLYNPNDSRDNCGFGLIAQVNGNASHKLVKTAIHALDRMQHRGGIAADGKTGDGCGLLLQKPDAFFQEIAKEKGWLLAKNYAVGMVFLSNDPEKAQQAREILNEELENETLAVLGWRQVPTNESILGDLAATCLPQIEQVFVNGPQGWRAVDLERRLFMARRRAEKRLKGDEEFYIASLSGLVSIYKGLVMPKDLPKFYLDLADEKWPQQSVCSTSVFPPTPCPNGHWHNLSDFWHTMAKSTLSGATGTGHRRVHINSAHR